METSPCMEVNSIYEGDNLEILNKFPSESVNLIYLDPPFFSNRHYEVIWEDGAELRAFQDRWQGGIEHYITWMEPRLRECQRILKKNGSIYLHCDWHAEAHLKILMDKIFGENNFQNQIVWKRAAAHNDPRRYGNIHDVILFYSKSKEYVWNPQYTDYSQEYLDAEWNKTPSGRMYKCENMLDPRNTMEEFNFHGTVARWRTNKVGMEELWNAKQTDVPKSHGRIKLGRDGEPIKRCRIKFLDEMQGVPLQSWWDDISYIAGKSDERLGYPTQKPVALLNRIVKSSSNEGDIVLDPFCGCGTTLVAAHKLGRKWIGIDVSPTACKLIIKRFRAKFATNPHLVKGTVDSKYIKKLQPFDFQNWVVVDKFLGNVSRTKSGDQGVDGLTPQISGGFPIQVKQSEGVGRNVIDNFETAMRKVKKNKGYVVAFSFGKGAYEEVARAKNQEGQTIILRTVQELIDGKVEE